MLDVWSSGYIVFSSTNAYSHGSVVQSDDGTKSYTYEFTIGKNASDGSIAWAGLNDNEDGNVIIDPSVVNMRFSNNATDVVFGDTVFLVSYVLTNYTLVVEQCDVDLSGVTSSKRGLQPLFQQNAELSAFFAKRWQW
jgi:hypothetical protein